MRFSLIAITNNRIELLLNTLNSLEIQTFKDFEIIIVDDGSDYIIEKMLNPLNFSFRIVHQRNKGKSGCSKARNSGIAKSNGEILLFIDSGMILIPEYLELYDKKYNELGKNVAISGYSYYMPENIIPENNNVIKYLDDIKNGKYVTEVCEVRKWYSIISEDDKWKCFIGNNCSCYKSDALEINGFNECFTVWGPDDIEFAYRLQKILGRKIVMVKELLSYHLWHPIANEQKKMENFLTSNKVFTQQHPEVKWSGILSVKLYKKYLEYSKVNITDEYMAILNEIENAQ